MSVAEWWDHCVHNSMPNQCCHSVPFPISPSSSKIVEYVLLQQRQPMCIRGTGPRHRGGVLRPPDRLDLFPSSISIDFTRKSSIRTPLVCAADVLWRNG